MELGSSQAAFSAYACVWRGSTREMGMNALSARHSTPVTTLAPQLHHHTTPQNTTESNQRAIHHISTGKPSGSTALKRRAKRRLPR
jgi:hypothetical protein